MANFLAPADLAKAFNSVSEKKVALPAAKMLILGILAGVYIGFAAHLATTIGTGSFEWLGMKKFMVGAVFSCGLMLVIIPGSELWTGNNLMVVGLLEKKFGYGPLLKNWFFVYLGNLIGSVLLALMIAKASGLLDGEIGGTAIKMLSAKSVQARLERCHTTTLIFIEQSPVTGSYALL